MKIIFVERIIKNTLVLLIIILFISSSFVNASTLGKKSFVVLQESLEEYYVKGCYFSDMGPGQALDWDIDYDEGYVHLSPGFGECYVIYEIDVDCSIYGITDLRVCAYHQNVVNPSSVYIFNYDTDSYEKLVDEMGQPNMVNYQLWCSNWISTPNKYVRNQKVKVKFWADGDLTASGENTKLKNIGILYYDQEETDQCNEYNDCSNVLQSGHYYVQSFKATFNRLSRIKLLFGSADVYDNERQIEIFITPNLKNGGDWTPIAGKPVHPRFPDGALHDVNDRWFEVKFDEVPYLVKGETYYICVADGDSDLTWSYSSDNFYLGGQAYEKTGRSPNDRETEWSARASRDYCFKTYGTSDYFRPPPPEDWTVEPNDKIEFGKVVKDTNPTETITIENGLTGGPLKYKVFFAEDQLIVSPASWTIEPGQSKEIDVNIFDTSEIRSSGTGVQVKIMKSDDSVIESIDIEVHYNIYESKSKTLEICRFTDIMNHFLQFQQFLQRLL